MAEGLGLRLCFIAFLLAIGRADLSSDLKEDDPSEDSRTGDLYDSEDSINEEAPEHQFDNLEDLLKQESVVPGLPGPYPSSDHESALRINISESLHGFPGGVLSRVIPPEEHILLNNIPGAENAITCTQEGEFHNIWSPDLQCLMCVCLSAYGALRPVCVSCSKCMVPPKPWTPEPLAPIAPPRPPKPYVIPSPASELSCRPLPSNVPFQSPMDPCKICVCTEFVDHFGKLDVQIRCRHNPQCVPDVTTQRIPITTEIPLPVCDKFPQGVPFPHPQDRCQICKCIVRHSPFGLPEPLINCYRNPECGPEPQTIEPETETPVTISPQPELDICDRYQINVVFFHPSDNCQVCKCILERKIFFKKKKILSCYVRPDCIPTQRPITTPEPWPTSTQVPEPVTQEPTPGPQPDNAKCAPLPVGTPFQNPLNPCQICICTQRTDLFGKLDVQIECQENPQCVLPPDLTTVIPPTIITPVPLPRCKLFPENILFPHPYDPCKVCKCSVLRDPSGAPAEHINCYTKPECRPAPLPEPVTTPTPEPTTTPKPPEPSSPETPAPSPSNNGTCAPLPAGSPFQNPLNPCQICICTQSLDLYGDSEVKIECEENPQCVLPPDVTTLSPDGPDVVLPACDQFPENVPFPHPNDACKVCKCTVQRQLYGHPQRVISCTTSSECIPVPEPTEPTTQSPEPEPSSCAPLPTGTPFKNPLNPCQTCVCSVRADLFGKDDVHIECQDNLECVLPPDVTTIPPIIPVPIILPACKQFPQNVFFPHPQDQCQVCKCIDKEGIDGKMENFISCSTIPECSPTTAQPGTTPAPEPLPQPVSSTTEIPQPEPFDLCQHSSVNVPFPHPTDPCRTCVCYWGPSPGSVPPPELPGSSALSHVAPAMQYRCFLKPECYPPTLEPQTIIPLPEPTPVPIEIRSCKPLPTGVPFQSPMNPCQICICSETTDVFGNPEVKIKCRDNHQCVLPYDVTTVPPTPPPSPIPLPACDKYPTNVVFPHPQDHCQECVCTLKMTNLGPKSHIGCKIKPECLPGPTTVAPPAPELSLCDQYPPNTMFPHPQDHCRLCRCTIQKTPSNGPQQHIYCSANPACSPTPPATTPAPWPPAPVDPLPGPSPHESCNPYKPNQPFQHPWDDCQVCVCREAISLQRITIEVNCYSKPSCCVEPPFDVPGLPGPGFVPGSVHIDHKGSHGTQSDIVHPPVKNKQRNLIEPEKENAIVSSSGHVIGNENVINQSGGNLFRPVGEKWFGPPPNHSHYRPGGISWFGPTSENLIKSAGERWYGPIDRNVIGPDGNVNNGVNLFKPSGEKWYVPSPYDLTGPENKTPHGHSGGNLIGPTGGNILKASHALTGPQNEKWFGPPGGSVNGPSTNLIIRPPEGNWIQPIGGNVIDTTGNLFKSPDGKLIGPNLPKIRPSGNLIYPLNRNQNYMNSGIVFPGFNGLSQIKSRDSAYANISPNIGFREADGMVHHAHDTALPGHHAMAKTTAGTMADAQNPEDQASGAVYKGSTKMRTKSARPRDNDTEDYD